VIRDPSRNVSIHIVSETDGGGIRERRIRSVGNRRPTGASGKYDPLLAGSTDAELGGAAVKLG
jgi:hypothetical protein